MSTTTVEFPVVVSADDGYIFKGALAPYPPGGAVSVNTGGNTWGPRRSYYGGTTYSISNGLMQVDSSTLPNDCIIISARLKIDISSIDDTDNRNFVAEWYDAANFPIDAGDYAEGSTGGAITVDIGTLSVGVNEIALMDPDMYISKTGYTALRLHISGGEPTGENAVWIKSIDWAVAPILSITYAPGTENIGVADGITFTDVIVQAWGVDVSDAVTFTDVITDVTWAFAIADTLSLTETLYFRKGLLTITVSSLMDIDIDVDSKITL